MTSNNNRACIVGIGQTPYKRWGTVTEESEFSIACKAIMAAAEDAGLPLSEIDGFSAHSDDRNDPARLEVTLGIKQLRLATMVWGGGGGGASASLSHAVAAVENGSANYVVVLRALCQGQQFRYGQFHEWSAHQKFASPYGLFSPPGQAALTFRRYMHLYQLKEEQLARVALACRANANRNPNAVMYDKPLDMETYLAGRMIAEPYRLYDCCLETDGACALIVTTRERAADLPGKAAHVLAVGQGGDGRWGTGNFGNYNMPEEIFSIGPQARLANELFARAGVDRSDVDVAQIYDAFSGGVITTLEAFGFCGPGEAGSFAEDGNLDWPNGGLPINTAGGLLSEAYVHGLNLLVEGVRQVRGESTSQVDDAKICLVTAAAVTPTSATLLGSEPN
ncbi:hypothetical protein [Sneathiella sp.]|uniref:thiolase C-terminal domain-containing protein n=1 Tax=Sneathiella sp. TaxID=1964365 RepID=UPI0035615852